MNVGTKSGKKKLYIVTGAAGHLPGCILRELRTQDCLIRGLILPTEHGDSDEQITYYHGDITKPDTLTEVFSGIENYDTIVIHVAGLISIQRRTTPRLYDVNVNGTKNVIEACKRTNVRRLVYISSVHAIPEPSEGAVIHEANYFSKDLVHGAYAQTKAEATQAVLDAGKAGMDVVVVHPSGMLGPYNDGSNHMVQLVQMYIDHKLPAGVAGGYDFADVRDVAHGVILAAEKGRSGECYILSNRYVTVKELLNFMRMAAGGRRRACVPLWMAKAAAPVFEKVSQITHTRPLFTQYSLETISGNGLFSHDKATMELGYTPRDMKETVSDTIRWLKEHSASEKATTVKTHQRTAGTAFA